MIDAALKIVDAALNEAGKKAMRKVSADLKKEGKNMNGWGPALDGDFLPYQPSEPAAKELSKNIPLLVGTTKNEFAPFIPGPKSQTMDELKAALQKNMAIKPMLTSLPRKKRILQFQNHQNIQILNLIFVH